MTGTHSGVRLHGGQDAPRRTFNLATLVGSGHKIVLFTLPFLALGVVLNVARPSWFEVGGPAPALLFISSLALGAGITI